MTKRKGTEQKSEELEGQGQEQTAAAEDVKTKKEEAPINEELEAMKKELEEEKAKVKAQIQEQTKAIREEAAAAKAKLKGEMDEARKEAQAASKEERDTARAEAKEERDAERTKVKAEKATERATKQIEREKEKIEKAKENATKKLEEFKIAMQINYVIGVIVSFLRDRVKTGEEPAADNPRYYGKVVSYGQFRNGLPSYIVQVGTVRFAKAYSSLTEETEIPADFVAPEPPPKPEKVAEEKTEKSEPDAE